MGKDYTISINFQSGHETANNSARIFVYLLSILPDSAIIYMLVFGSQIRIVLFVPSLSTSKTLAVCKKGGKIWQKDYL